MPVDLLKSQFEALEVPKEDEPNVINIDIKNSFEQVVESCISATKMNSNKQKVFS